MFFCSQDYKKGVSIEKGLLVIKKGFKGKKCKPSMSKLRVKILGKKVLRKNHKPSITDLRIKICGKKSSEENTQALNE